MDGRVGVVLAVVVAFAPVGCSRRPLAGTAEAGVVPGADGGSDVLPDVGVAETTPDVAFDVRRDVGAETPPDVARDVAAETPADVATDAPPDSLLGGDAGGDADRPGDGGVVPTGRALSLLTNWPISEATGSRGLAVDAANRVFRADSQNIYVFEAGLFRTYLSIGEALSGVRLIQPGGFTDIDAGPDGMLYVLLTGNAGDAVPSAMVVARSSSAHLAARLLDFRPEDATVMRVISPAKVGIFDFAGGLFTASPAGQQLVYSDSSLGPSCARANITRGTFAVGPTDLFLFSYGCDGSPILRGNFDGSGVIELYKPGSSPIGADTFTCLARDPAGGFYVMVTGDGTGTRPTSGTRIYHLADDAGGTSGFTRMGTVPSFDQARLGQVDPTVFTTCALAAAPDGTLYVQTLNQVWKLAP